MKTRRRRLLLHLPVCGVAFFGATSWPEYFYCVHCDVDIRTGRIRRQSILLGICIAEQIEETQLSRQLPKLQDAAEPQWRRAVTSAPFGYISPHYAFHGAAQQVHRVEQVWQKVPFTADAKRLAAEKLIENWHSYSGATGYVIALEIYARSRRETAQAIDVDDLVADLSARYAR